MKKIFVFLWLLFIPTQLGMHFWPEWSHVLGLRVDYLSPILYFGDILWILMVGIIFNFKFLIFNQIKRIFNFKFLIIFSFVLINIFVAGNHWVSIVRWVRIFQWIFTFNLIINNKKLFKEMLVKVLPFWIIGEGLLAVGQVVNGGSLNGIFYWLGERRFSYASIGVAQISYLGEGLIRAYGTFSHPNSMAGFMLVALYLFISISPNPLFDKRGQNLLKIFKWVVIFCGILGIVLIGSRTVWIISIILFLYQIYKFWQKGGHAGPPVHKILGILLIAGGSMAFILSLISSNYRISDFIGGWDSDGMSKRGALMVASLKMIKDNPLAGVGANNFLVKLPEYQLNSGVFWLQPVHNIIFLITTEFGFIGIALLFLFIKKIIYKNNIILLGIILVTGMVDHYWLTLPQNWWLMCVVLGIL